MLANSEYYLITLLCVPCSYCGARIGERCLGAWGRPVTYNWHVARKAAMKEWRETHPEEYERLKQQVIAENRRKVE